MSDEREDLEDAIREYGFDYAYGRPTDQTAWKNVLVKIGEYGQFQLSRGSTLTEQQIESLRLAHRFAGFGTGATCRALLEEAFPELDYIMEGEDDD